MQVVLEHLTDVAGRVHVENVNIRIHIHPTSTFVRFSVPFDVHTVFVSLRVPRMQPVACLRQKTLERHRPAYEKQGQRQIRAAVMLPC